MKCVICNSDKLHDVTLVSFREKIYGKKWEYIKCQDCGCLFIKRIPENISDYYDSEYESFAKENTHTINDILFEKNVI